MSSCITLFDKLFEDGTDERVFDLLLGTSGRSGQAQSRLSVNWAHSAMQLVKSLNLGGLMQFAINAFIGYLDEDKLGTMVQSFHTEQDC